MWSNNAGLDRGDILISYRSLGRAHSSVTPQWSRHSVVTREHAGSNPTTSQSRYVVFGRPFAKRFAAFALWYRTVVCLFVLSVTLVYCGQTVGWTRSPFGTEVGLGPGHIVLDGDPAPPPTERGTAVPHISAHFALARSPISATAKVLYTMIRKRSGDLAI